MALAAAVQSKRNVASKTGDKSPFWNSILQNGWIVIQTLGVDPDKIMMKSIYDATFRDSADWHVF